MRSGYDWWEDLPNEVVAMAISDEDALWRLAAAGVERLAAVANATILHSSGLTFGRGNLFSGKGTRTSPKA